MSSDGIGSLSESQLQQINKLASEKGAEKKILVAKLKGRKVKFYAVKPKLSFKFVRKTLISGSKLTSETLGLKNRLITPAKAQTIIKTYERVNNSSHASLEDINFLRNRFESTNGSLNSDLSSSTTSLDSGVGSSLSGSMQSLNSIDSEQEESSPSIHSGLHSELNKELKRELKKRSAIKGQPIRPYEVPPKPKKFQEATPSSHHTFPEIPSGSPELQKTGFALLPSKAQIAKLKETSDPELIGRFLDECSTKQKEKLSKKGLPKHCWPAMNRRLLADKLEIHTAKNPGGMYRAGSFQTTLNKSIGNFNKQRISGSILNDPINAAQLFKRTHDSHKLFSLDTSSKVFEIAKKEPVDQQKIKQVFDNALNDMTPDDRDQLKVSLKVMRNAYQAAPDVSSNTDAAVAKRDLANLFSESVLTFPPLPIPETSEEGRQVQSMVASQKATGLKIVEILLNQS